ncbi:hypothetical protein GO013_16020 [Pseudodesulfovibrio sp. JC047]|uniref:phage tail assembly protein n=1 Tax=Pseudodesulfovibrio sp. JC047 TaxID=2683199 RepID=UPI0013D177FC|nr:phage tail assembly protein [Pseudodesulfovibrio sp. JC047]NDV20918.1 hypothetical protein [Pseudodesulfovibrio sp. JC047]
MPLIETIPLTTPVTIGKNECHEIVLREATGGDVIEAQEESEKLVMTADGPQLVASPTLVGMGVLRRQVVKIGDVDGPVDLVTLKRLSVYDLNQVQLKADAMDAATEAEALKARTAMRGRTGEQDG